MPCICSVISIYCMHDATAKVLIYIRAEVIVQKRWKSLRDKFRKLAKVQEDAQKSGAGTDDVDDSLADKTWLYSDLLSFLKDTVEACV